MEFYELLIHKKLTKSMKISKLFSHCLGWFWSIQASSWEHDQGSEGGEGEVGEGGGGQDGEGEEECEIRASPEEGTDVSIKETVNVTFHLRTIFKVSHNVFFGWRGGIQWNILGGPEWDWILTVFFLMLYYIKHLQF